MTRAARGVWRRRLRRVAAVVAAPVVAVTVAAAVYDVTSQGTVPAPSLDAHGRRVLTEDIESHYEQWGHAGPPIVLVHGFLESAAVWDRVGPVLARDGYRVYALDVRGFGYTQRRGPYTLAGDVAQLSAFLSALHLDAAHGGTATLVGHSSGAAIVGGLARAQPADVRGVVFLDGDGTPYGVGPAWVHHLVVDPYATALIRLMTRHPWLVERVYRDACGPSCPAFDPAAWVTPFRVPGAERALEAVLRQPLIGLTYAEERQIHVRSAVIYGSQDPTMSAAGARSTAARLRTDVVVAIPDAAHLPMLSAPATLATEVERFVRPPTAGQRTH